MRGARAERDGGTIGGRNRDGGGAVFEIRMPQRYTPEGAMMVLVDDSPDLLELMLLALRPLGLGDAVVTFQSGEECLSAIERGAVTPRLVLMDVNMPGLDGPATTARLRELFGRRAAIVLMSTSDRAEDVERGIAAGADSYVMKPCANRTWTDMLANVTGYWLGSDLRARL